MKSILLVTALFFSGACFSQTSIKLEDAAKHVGDSVVVCGKVAGGAFLDQMENGPTFLSLGAPYPDQLLTLVIWQDQRAQYTPEPEIQYMDKDVCVTGKIMLMRETPRIVIYKKDQIKVTAK